MIKTLAQVILRRCEAQGVKGRKRDEACLEFFVGAGALAAAQGQDDLASQIAFATMLVATRGHRYVVEAAARS